MRTSNCSTFLQLIPRQVAALAALWLFAHLSASAQEAPDTRGNPIILSKHVVAGGGGSFSSGSITIRGTIAQPLATSPSGGATTLSSGFWSSIAAPTLCFGDANHDGLINFADITSVLANFNSAGAQPLAGDANADGLVLFSDITAVLTVFGTDCD